MAKTNSGDKRDMNGCDRDWWRGSVIYQIYPRSFMDANGDGIGDLEGIRQALPHVASLGVDAIWISPFFLSPMKDFGYDISDYRAVDPMFGTLEDFDCVVEEAHRLGLRVLIDQVLPHSSDRHPWFEESRRDRTNPRADWYVWADSKPDGSPPNNWLSVFGGSAWQWDTGRCQYYLHNFLISQPDLNWHNPEVAAAMLDQLRFWLERGVDGFRLDTINFCLHDPELRDNPPLEGGREPTNAPPDNPYTFQHHIYDKSRPEMLDLLRRLRALTDEYGDIVLMGEIGDEDARTIMAQYTSGGDKLHMGYGFDLLTERTGARLVRDNAESMEAALGDGYTCWSLGNHDVPRVASRWGKGAAPEHVTPLYTAMILTLRGSACLYQGDELGLPEAELGFEDLQDPYGIAMWPGFKGRDGCRTPMPWQVAGDHAGFSETRPWLPIPAEHRDRAVDSQEEKSDSVLNFFRCFLHWRRSNTVLRDGAIRFHTAPSEVLLLERMNDDTRMLAAFNLSSEPENVPVPEGISLEPLEGHGFTGELGSEGIRLNPWQAFFADATAVRCEDHG